MTTKDLLEIIILIIGGGGGAFMAGAAVAIHQEKQKLDELRLEIKDYQLDFQNQIHHTLNAGQKEFARKVQQNIDANQVDIGVLKGDVDDIKEMLPRNNRMKARPDFPAENKPKHTGWTIEDA